MKSGLKAADAVKPPRTGRPEDVRLNDAPGALYVIGCVAPDISGQLGGALDAVKLV